MYQVCVSVSVDRSGPQPQASKLGKCASQGESLSVHRGVGVGVYAGELSSLWICAFLCLIK